MTSLRIWPKELCMCAGEVALISELTSTWYNGKTERDVEKEFKMIVWADHKVMF